MSHQFNEANRDLLPEIIARHSSGLDVEPTGYEVLDPGERHLDCGRFGVSPTTASSQVSPVLSRSPTTTKPVATPTWAASGVSAAMISRATDSISDSPTYTARSAASS